MSRLFHHLVDALDRRLKIRLTSLPCRELRYLIISAGDLVSENHNLIREMFLVEFLKGNVPCLIEFLSVYVVPVRAEQHTTTYYFFCGLLATQVFHQHCLLQLQPEHKTE